MTGTDDGPEEDTAEKATDSTPDLPLEKMSTSRFDPLFDRLAGRDADDRSSEENDDEQPGAEIETTNSDTETGDAEAELNGWVWGPTKQPSADESVSGAGSEPETRSSQPPEADPDRIWNADLEELFDAELSEPKPVRDRAGKSDDSRDDPGREAQHPSDQAGHDDPLEPMESRWSELESGQRKAEAGPSEPYNESPDESQWERSETTAPSDQGIAGTAPLSSDEQSAALDRVTDSASVLVLGPTDHPVADAICSRFVAGDEGSRNCLFVTFQDDPNDRIDVCHHADDWTGGDIGVIEVGRGRGASETTTSAGGGSITVRHVSNPGDLSKLGIVITQLLAEFDETPQQTALCFHTLSALHNQVGTKTLFRFLNTLQSRLRSSNAVGHYHMDPELHDEIVIETLRPIFDSVVRYSADGDLSVE